MKSSIFLAQFPVALSITKNLESIETLLDKSQPGDIAVFPEGSISGYSQDLSFLKNIDSEEMAAAWDRLREQAQRHQIYIWAGSLIPEGDLWFNAALGFTPSGGMYQYRKINLATHERGTITPGSDLPVFELELPDGKVKIGIQICREIRYPEQWEWLSRQGSQIILHLNNAVNDARYLPVWRSHIISHSASNQRYVVSSNNAADEQNCPTMVVSPHGWVLEEIISSNPEYSRVELDLTQVSDYYLDQARQDVVSTTEPDRKERRKILRAMRIERLQDDFEELQKNPDLFDESNLSARTEALDFIKMIEDMQRVRSKDRDLGILYYQALNFRRRLEYINTRLFSKLRGKIIDGDCDRSELRAQLDMYTDYEAANPYQPHYGYEDLDGLIAGVFLTNPAPEETLERQPGMIRYQPTPASVILELIDQVGFFQEDVFCDLGSGMGQVIGLVNLLTGIKCIGVEYQPTYCDYASQMAADLGLKEAAFENIDAQDFDYSKGTVFFMFNPFGGRIFDAVMEKLQTEAQSRKITLCSYGSCTEPISELPWIKNYNTDTIHEFKLAIFKC